VQAGLPGIVHDSDNALTVVYEAFAEKKANISFKMVFNRITKEINK